MAQLCKRFGCGRTFNPDVNPNTSKDHGYCCFECFKACEPEEAEKAAKQTEMIDKAIIAIVIAVLTAIGAGLFHGFKWLAKTRRENPALYKKALVGIVIVLGLTALGMRGCTKKAEIGNDIDNVYPQKPASMEHVQFTSADAFSAPQKAAAAFAKAVTDMDMGKIQNLSYGSLKSYVKRDDGAVTLASNLGASSHSNGRPSTSMMEALETYEIGAVVETRSPNIVGVPVLFKSSVDLRPLDEYTWQVSGGYGKPVKAVGSFLRMVNSGGWKVCNVGSLEVGEDRGIIEDEEASSGEGEDAGESTPESESEPTAGRAKSASAPQSDVSGEPEAAPQAKAKASPEVEPAAEPAAATTPTTQPAAEKPAESKVASSAEDESTSKPESISEMRRATLGKAADQLAKRVLDGEWTAEQAYRKIRASGGMTDSEKSMFCDMLAKRGITEKQPSPSPADANAAEEAKRADEEAEKKRIADEAEKKRIAEEAEKKRIAEEEAKRKAEEAQRKRKEEFDRKQKLAEEKRKKMLEEARKKNEDAARLAKEREEQEKKAREEETRKKQDEANARLEALRQQALKAAEKREEEEDEEEDVGGGVGIDRRMLESAGMGRSRATVLNDADGLREVAEAEARRREATRRNEEERAKFQADYLRRQAERNAEAARIREEMASQEAAMQAEMTTADAMVTQLAQGILLSIQSGQMTKDQASLMLNGSMLTAEQKAKVREILALKGVQLAK